MSAHVTFVVALFAAMLAFAAFLLAARALQLVRWLMDKTGHTPERDDNNDRDHEVP
jgi:hypothetical protein